MKSGFDKLSNKVSVLNLVLSLYVFHEDCVACFK